MRRRRWAAAVLLLLLLSGCTEPEASTSTGGNQELPMPTQARSETPVPETSEALSEATGTADFTEPRTDSTASSQPEPPETASGGSQPVPTEPITSEPAPTEAAEARPRVLSLGLYTGPYPEDGSGEPVDSVAVILVENDSDTQLQFAELHYRIDERDALFRVSELPPGERALVVEHSQLVATPVSVWKAVPEEDLLVYLAAEALDGLEVRYEKAGWLRVMNKGSKAASFDLIYKQRGEDGVYTGGIAYHVAVPILKPGESADLEAPHYTEASVVVRITAKVP